MEAHGMRTSFLLCATAAGAAVLSGCPLRGSNEAIEDMGPEVSATAPEAVETEETAPGSDLPSALQRSRPEDRAVLEPILAYLGEGQADESASGLETATWISYQDVMEEDLTPEDVGEDAMVYKIVEEDAWLSVLFGPPFSEFYLEFRLAVSHDGTFEVIGCEFLPEFGEE
jgi:hypothetical protein